MCDQVVDFGCAECKLLRLLKKEEYIEELVGIDVDSVPLRVHSELVRPLITDHLHPRPHPLHMALMQGTVIWCSITVNKTSVCNVWVTTGSPLGHRERISFAGSIAHPDAKLVNFDLLTCIEVYVVSLT